MPEALTVTDYRGDRQTLLPVQEINLKAYMIIILEQLSQALWRLNSGPDDNCSRG